MLNLDIRDELPVGSIVLDNAYYDNSIIGTTLDGRVIYDFNLMVEEYMTDNDCSELEAVEWIEYNTMRAIPYMGDKAPVVVNWI